MTSFQSAWFNWLSNLRKKRLSLQGIADMTTRWKCICALLVFTLTTTLLAASASAKSPGIGDMSGRVVDTEGVAIKGAIVFTRFRDFKSDDPVVANMWYPTRTDEHGDF